MEQEARVTTCKCCPGWVTIASQNLAAFQIGVEEDEGSLPRLSQRESKGPAKLPTHICRGRPGAREARPKRAAHSSIGDGRGCTRHTTPKHLWGAICFTIRYQILFSEGWKHTICRLTLFFFLHSTYYFLKHQEYSSTFFFSLKISFHTKPRGTCF